GRWTAGGPGRAGAPAAADAAGGADRVIALAYRVAAAQYLTRTEALLTGFRAETRAGEPAAQFTAQARDLLTTTRLMLDSPAARALARAQAALAAAQPTMARLGTMLNSAGLAQLDELDGQLAALGLALAQDEQDPTDSLWRAARRALNRGDYATAANLYGDLA